MHILIINCMQQVSKHMFKSAVFKDKRSISAQSIVFHISCTKWCQHAVFSEVYIHVLLQVRQNRDPEAAKKCLAAIAECARTREGNLLALAVEAARARLYDSHTHLWPCVTNAECNLPN